MDKIFTAYTAAKGRTLSGDFTDKLHSRFSVTLLLAILLLLMSRQYSGNAIACWLPKQFSGDQEAYIHQFCWINNTYYYPDKMQEPDHFHKLSQDKYTIRYYQFILFILSGQIMLFFIPSLLWKSIASDSGTYINKLLDSLNRNKVFSEEAANAEDPPEPPKFPLVTLDKETGDVTPLNESIVSEKRSLLSNSISDQFKEQFNHLKRSSSLKNSTSRNNSMKKESYDAQSPINEDEPIVEFAERKPKKKNFIKRNLKVKKLGKVIIKPIRGVKNLAFYYFGMKFFNVVNVLFQLIGLKYIFGNDFWRYGYDYMVKVMNNEDPLWMSKQFPIVTICDYYVHQNLRKLHWNSSQCLLAINILIEKFYVFIWLWLYILLILTILNILSWFHEIYSRTRTDFIYKYLRIKEKMNENWIESRQRYAKTSSLSGKQDYLREVTFQSETHVTKQGVALFQQEYLGNDGLVMMHIVKSVAGDMIFIDLLNSLWTEYLRRKEE